MQINIKDLPKLKAKYEEAVSENKDIFVFKGAEVYTGYAKYLIEYMEQYGKEN